MVLSGRAYAGSSGIPKVKQSSISPRLLMFHRSACRRFCAANANDGVRAGFRWSKPVIQSARTSSCEIADQGPQQARSRGDLLSDPHGAAWQPILPWMTKVAGTGISASVRLIRQYNGLS